MSRAFAPGAAPQFASLTPGMPGAAELCVALPQAPPAHPPTPTLPHKGGGGTGAPFVVLNDTGSLARTLAGCIRTSGGSVVRHLALRIQRNAPRAGAGRIGPAWTSPQLAEHFAREGYLLQRLAEAGAAPEFFAVTPPGRNDGDPWPPRLYCRHRRVLFAPRDPDSLEELVECRDDALLVSRGLPAWSAGVRRFLYSPARAKAGDPRFYCEAGAADAALRAAKGPVSDRDELLAAFPRIVSRYNKLAAEQPARHEELKRTFPCYDCPNKTECYGVSGNIATPTQAERLTELSFHEFHLTVSELMPLHYDELCDILGGRRKLPEACAYRPWRQELPTAEWDREPAIGRLFGEGADDGTDLLEIFALRLHAFLQAAEAVAGHHRITGRPHLNIQPRHLVADLGGGPASLPGLWNFRVRIIDPTAARQVEEMPGVYAPPANRVPAYCAPVLLQELFGARERAGFTLTDVKTTAGKPQLIGELRGELTNPARFSPLDRFGLMLPSPDGEPTEVCFRLRTDAPAAGNVLPLSADASGLSPARLAHLTSLKGVPLGDVSYAVYPILHAPCDLHSLGVLLLRTLLVNDTQDLPGARRAADSALQPLVAWVAANPTFTDAELLTRLDDIIACLPENVQAVLSPSAMLYAAKDRTPGRPDAVPRKLWLETLLTAGRCLAGGPASFCRHHGDFDPDFPADKIESLIRRIDVIVRKVHALLFFAQSRNAEVRSVINGVLLEAASPADSGGTAAGSLLLGRLARCLEAIEGAALKP